MAHGGALRIANEQPGMGSGSVIKIAPLTGKFGAQVPEARIDIDVKLGEGSPEKVVERQVKETLRRLGASLQRRADAADLTTAR